MSVVWIPYAFAEAKTAKAWLESQGWKVGKRRTKKGRSDIPSPRPEKTPFYDLHDISYETGRRIHDLVQQIRTFARDDSVAGVTVNEEDVVKANALIKEWRRR